MLCLTPPQVHLSAYPSAPFEKSLNRQEGRGRKGKEVVSSGKNRYLKNYLEMKK